MEKNNIHVRDAKDAQDIYVEEMVVFSTNAPGAGRLLPLQARPHL